MLLKLTSSVGKDGTNLNRDVKIVQLLLNIFNGLDKPVAHLKVNGLFAKDTRVAIENFQKHAVRMDSPDARVDVDGTTFRYLTMYLNEQQQTAINNSITSSKSIPKLDMIKLITTRAGLNDLSVTYKSSLPKADRIVSNYSLQVIKMALKESGMTHAVITSTIRGPHEQATIMYNNAKINYDAQVDLYGATGEKVLEVYDENKSKTKAEVIKLMEDKMVALANEKPAKLVSKHVVPKDIYLKRNIIDIGVGSTKAVSKNFDINKFTKAIKSLKKQGYIARFFDETKKSNKAWHIEIVVGSKPLLEKPVDASILATTRWC